MFLFSFFFNTKGKSLADLNKDELFCIANKLDLSSLLRLSVTNKRLGEKLKNVWDYKLKEFDEHYKINMESKAKYLLLYRLTILRKTLAINEDIYKIYNWENLFLNGKQLREVPKEIEVLTNLKNIYLSDNHIKILPKQFFNLINLEEIYLSNNNLEEIPYDINRLINLKNLFCGKNRIKIFPKLELPQLRAICLSKNFIEKIPSDIIRLTNLERLYLHDNKIKSLPQELENMPNLKVFTFMKNPIEKVSDKIKSLNAFSLYK